MKFSDMLSVSLTLARLGMILTLSLACQPENQAPPTTPPSPFGKPEAVETSPAPNSPAVPAPSPTPAPISQGPNGPLSIKALDSAKSSAERNHLLVVAPDRFPQLAAVTSSKKVGKGQNGLEYQISRHPLDLPGDKSGKPKITEFEDDLLVCRTIDQQFADVFTAPLVLPGGNQDENVIFPGALFKDQGVVKGLFQPLYPKRKPASIGEFTLASPGNSITVPVANLNDNGVVANAVNALRGELKNTPVATDIQDFSLQFKGSLDFNLDLGASASVDLSKVTDIPVNVATSPTFKISAGTALNAAVRVVRQRFYTISLAADSGPAATIDGPVSPDAVCVTDVQWGRLAYIVVASSESRAETEAHLEALVKFVKENQDLGKASQELDAKLKALIDTNLVRVAVVGGKVKTASGIKGLEDFQKYLTDVGKGTVGTVDATPISYTLRYAADNASPSIGAIAKFADRECFRADTLEVTLESLTPTNVVDWGNEELYGTVSVEEIGKISTESNVLWRAKSASPVQGIKGRAIEGTYTRFHINPARTMPQDVVVEFDVRDRIMRDPEWIGATIEQQERGYVRYSPGRFKVSLSGIAAEGGTLSKKINLQEGDATIDARLKFELKPASVTD